MYDDFFDVEIKHLGTYENEYGYIEVYIAQESANEWNPKRDSDRKVAFLGSPTNNMILPVFDLDGNRMEESFCSSDKWGAPSAVGRLIARFDEMGENV